ncbi:Ger(x)C family spore germination protein [Paenibacillus frigoriresistens]|uniref:Ger(x)C family spore germination protein n=1 Tax=Paenibacillus alginolyticus TaxID=59839 RepID=UPI0015645A3F|nr:Ger(x)C family spore germination protein [Paenibacillus frigoriresistens]NRF93486.1 Ger(x)C family spore germination protein [Paenibacillus frigoriresistens]
MTYILRSVLSLLAISLLSGCWDNKDINKRILPVAMAISQTDAKTYKVGLRVPQPNSSNTTPRILTGEASTISEALDRIRGNVESSIDLLHLKLLMIDEKTAKLGIKEVLEYAIRSHDIAPKSLVSVYRGDFIEMLNKKEQGGAEGGTASYDYFNKLAGWTPNTSIVYLWEAFRGGFSHTEDYALPIIKSGDRTMFKIDGSAIMSRGVMVGTISSDDTLIYNVMKGDFQGANVEVMEHSTVLIIDVDFKHRHHWDGDTPHVETDMKVVGMLLETKGNPRKEQIKEELTKLLNKRANAMLAKLQENQSDLFGYGQYFRNDLSHDQLKKWREFWYPQLKITLNVKVNIRNSGNLKFNTIDS